MNKKLRIKKGDSVKVISGNYKGKQGKVLEVIVDTDRVIVEGVNMITKHTKPNAKHPQGARVEREAPIHISNVQLICPETGKPTRVGRRLSEKPDKNGKFKLVRFSKRALKETGKIKILS